MLLVFSNFLGTAQIYRSSAAASDISDIYNTRINCVIINQPPYNDEKSKITGVLYRVHHQKRKKIAQASR
jgi:hypothetical protein